MKFGPWLSLPLVFAIASCSHGAPVVPQGQTARSKIQGLPGSAINCEREAVQNVGQLLGCIRREPLWDRLSQFQRIADQNPGPEGHPNRDTGTRGYLASVKYVAGLMRQAGYDVTIQPYHYLARVVSGSPVLGSAGETYSFDRDWYVARGSAGGDVSAYVQLPDGDGCSGHDFSSFGRGNVALIPRSDCAIDVQVRHAEQAGAAAAIVYAPADGAAHEARLTRPARIPVVAVASNAVGTALLRQYGIGSAPKVRLAVRTQTKSGIDYNVIADSPYGDANHVVVVDAHLDSIYGAGILDNASGSTTTLEVALNLAKTPTRNRLRYMWFGGEELGLLGSAYYTTHLTRPELKRIAFDEDVDVTATPNFDILVADPAFAFNVNNFPDNVVPQSRLGNDYYADFFARGGVISRPAWFGNDGTDSNSFSLAGVPNTGILTNQDCCKRAFELKLWGGFLGNYEGKIPSFNGGCVDQPGRWCDNLSNNDPFVLELTAKAAAYVTYELANDPRLDR